VSTHKKLTRRKGAKTAEQIIFVIKCLHDLCVFAVKLVSVDEHRPSLPPEEQLLIEHQSITIRPPRHGCGQ
jgi:hypothetical protein